MVMERENFLELFEADWKVVIPEDIVRGESPERLFKSTTNKPYNRWGDLPYTFDYDMVQ